MSGKPEKQATKGDGDVATNRKARHAYAIEQTWEAGLALRGSEVKSLRAAAVTIGDGFVIEDGGELWLMNVHVNEYAQANQHNHEPMRKRKLLLHRSEIEAITKQIQERGRTCVPLRFYFERGLAKVEIATCVGKKLHDKRESLKEKDAKRDMDRARQGRGDDD